MYVIKVDGQVLYSPALSDAEYQIISPKLKYAIGKSDSFSFTLPPVHAMKDAFQKMRSIVTVEWRGKEIFRGRVSETNTDFYNQVSVYCEGELSFLLDSLQRPIDFKGTAADFFRLLIDNHNAQVDAERQFAVGTISAVTDENKMDVETDGYASTLSEIRSTIVQRFGGYLRVRRENGVRYIDYLNKYNETSDQKIEFGVNLLDIEKHINVQDIYTVLVPLGKHDGKAQLTIKSVNNGLDYIEDAEGIAKYGRITKEYTWDEIEDPQQLLELAQKKLSEAGFAETLTINAIDLHLLNAEADSIGLGDSVHILSAPHSYDKELVCSAIDADLLNPENTTYTFGKVEDSLTNNVVSNKRNSHQCHVSLRATHSEYQLLEGQVEEFYSSFSEVSIKLDAVTTTIDLKADKTETTAISERLSSAEILIDGANAAIALKADRSETNALGTRMSTAEANIDAANAAINLLANTADLSALESRVSSAEVRIDAAESAINLLANVEDLSELEERVGRAEVNINAANSQIALKASQEVVEEYGYRLTTAEANIDAANAQIELKVNKDGLIGAINVSPEEARIKAAKIVLDGYVTASTLSSEIASIRNQVSTSIVTSSVSANSVSCNSLTLSDASLRLRTGSFVTAVTMPKVSGKYIWYLDDTMDIVQQYVLTGFTQGTVTTSSLVYCGTN